nr:MAG TPA: DNA primase, catalytic core [Caudoviricetes sp.]
MATQAEVNIFVALLKHYGIFEPQDKYKIVCPFHEDQNASLQINVSDAFFFCYAGCGAQGGSLELYKNFYRIQNPGKPPVSDLQASIAIKKIVGSKFPFGGEDGLRTAVKPKESYRIEITQAREYYYNLPSPCWYRPSKVKEISDESFECRQYMNGRGFSNSILTQFQAKPSMNKYYPIVFPLLENGIFRGYVMRTFDKQIEEQRKYMYNRGFKRQDALPGRFKGTDTVICVEGYFDLIKANQIGCKNVVCFLGWKASENQLHKLKKNKVKTIICALDSDEAGRKGYHYLQRISKQYGFKIKRLRYPKGIKDFGDIKQESVQAENVMRQIKALQRT